MLLFHPQACGSRGEKNWKRGTFEAVEAIKRSHPPVGHAIAESAERLYRAGNQGLRRSGLASIRSNWAWA
jgi:hypothetical protein